MYIFIKKKKKAKQKSFKEIRAILLHFLRLGSKLHIIWYQKFSDRHISEIEFLGTSVKNCFEVFSFLSHLMISLSSAVPSVCSILKNHQIWPKNMIKILKEKLCSIWLQTKFSAGSQNHDFGVPSPPLMKKWWKSVQFHCLLLASNDFEICSCKKSKKNYKEIETVVHDWNLSK